MGGNSCTLKFFHLEAPTIFLFSDKFLNETGAYENLAHENHYLTIRSS